MIKMEKEINTLKKAVEELAETLGVEMYEFCMEEDTDVYNDFGKMYGRLASEIYKDMLYQGLDLRVSIIEITSRCRFCNSEPESVEFWEDLTTIVCLVNALEEEVYFNEPGSKMAMKKEALWEKN